MKIVDFIEARLLEQAEEEGELGSDSQAHWRIVEDAKVHGVNPEASEHFWSIAERWKSHVDFARIDHAV
ncbi:hypothetical protein [Rhodococcus qingshengii]|uniref:hypothetical protein n=1 Tax=Rhodococcus qingshengii TaxID=334542 RepID=UPI00360377C3